MRAAARHRPSPSESWQRRVTWPDVIADPIGAITPQYGNEAPDLPDGIYDAHSSYPLAGVHARRARREGPRRPRPPEPGLRRPRHRHDAPRAARPSSTPRGSAPRMPPSTGTRRSSSASDVAAQLVADQLKAQLKAERARARTARATAAAASAPAGADAAVAEPAAETEEQAKARRRAERAAELERRQAAVAFNLELGVAVVKAFAKVRLDDRALKILTAVDFKDDLDALAARGARYGFPGWPVEETTRRRQGQDDLPRALPGPGQGARVPRGRQAARRDRRPLPRAGRDGRAGRRDLRRAVQPLHGQPQRLHRRQLRGPRRDAARAAVAPPGRRARRGARDRATARAPHRDASANAAPRPRAGSRP